jgi:hypothetical protein
MSIKILFKIKQIGKSVKSERSNVCPLYRNKKIVIDKWVREEAGVLLDN